MSKELKKVYVIFNEQWEENDPDSEDYILFGSRVYLSEEKAKAKCAELNAKFQESIKNSETKLRRVYHYEYRLLDEESA